MTPLPTETTETLGEGAKPYGGKSIFLIIVYDNILYYLFTIRPSIGSRNIPFYF